MRLRRLPRWARGWRWRTPAYGALRQVWHPYFGYGGRRPWRSKPNNASICAAEYAYQLGAAALHRQAGSAPGGGRYNFHRLMFNEKRVLAAVAKRHAADHAVDQGLGLA